MTSKSISNGWSQFIENVLVEIYHFNNLWIVDASSLVNSDNRFAARPVGATSPIFSSGYNER